MDLPTNPQEAYAYLDKRLASVGGYENANVKLTKCAYSYRREYHGAYWMDPEDAVQQAWERVFKDFPNEDENLYHALRRHVQNYIRTNTKRPVEKNQLSSDSSEALSQEYAQHSDPTEIGTVESVESEDLSAFHKKMLYRVRSAVKDDPKLGDLIDAIIAGFSADQELCEYCDFNEKDLKNAKSRLRYAISNELKDFNLEKI